MRYFYWRLLCLFLVLSLTVNAQQRKALSRYGYEIPITGYNVIDSALQYAGAVEKKDNWGEPFKTFLNSVGIKAPAPYCAAFGSYILTLNDIKNPSQRTAMARRFLSKKAIRAIDVYKGIKKLPEYFIVLWQKGNSWQGHFAFGWDWDKTKGNTIEGNTSSGQRGSQRNGDGVYMRQREIQLHSNMRITHFVPIE